MKKYFFLLLILVATTAVFSIPVDRPPDDNCNIEITQQNDFICPVVINESIVTVSETIYQKQETREPKAITARVESEALEPSIIERYAKIAGTENEQYGNYDNTFNSARNGNHYKINEILQEYSKEQPRIRSPDNNMQLSM
jgi:hypothetical protein